jgi:outer membrane lipoprotein-sorting protein
VRKLATHARRQKMQGSDFSYEDMGSGDSFVTDFQHELLGEEKMDGHQCYKVQLSRKEGVDSNYSKIIAWVEKERFVIWRLDYYDESDPEVVSKRLNTTDVKVVDGVPTPMNMVMHNLLDGTQTSQEFLEVSYNTNIDDSMFTERGLQG